MGESAVEWKGFKIEPYGKVYLVRHKRNGRAFDTSYTTVSKAKEGIIKYAKKKAEEAFKIEKRKLLKFCKDIKERQRRYKKLCKDHSTLLSNLLSED